MKSFFIRLFDCLCRILLWIPSKAAMMITKLTTTTPVMNPIPTSLAEKTAIWEEQGATWQYVEKGDNTSYYKLSNVPYTCNNNNDSNHRNHHHRRQTLNIYFPQRFIHNYHHQHQQQSTTTTINTDDDDYPVYIHVHGGGWSRGGKDQWLYGSPSIAESMVMKGQMIVITPNYRLGNYPQFMHDIASVLVFVRKAMMEEEGILYQRDNNATTTSTKQPPRGVFLSGHSAGAHIVALMALQYHQWVFRPHGIPLNFIQGIVLVSGIYDLFTPMQKHSFCDIKNKWFYLAYILPAFGHDPNIRKQTSPLLLLNPDKDINLWGNNLASAFIATSIRTLSTAISSSSFRNNASGSKDNNNKVPSSSIGDKHLQQQKQRQQQEDLLFLSTNEEEDEAATTTAETMVQTFSKLPPILILNAARDFGLHENGELFRDALQQNTQIKTRVEYYRIPGTDHASICWNETTTQIIRDFVISILPANGNTGDNDTLDVTPQETTEFLD